MEGANATTPPRLVNSNAGKMKADDLARMPTRYYPAGVGRIPCPRPQLPELFPVDHVILIFITANLRAIPHGAVFNQFVGVDNADLVTCFAHAPQTFFKHDASNAVNGRDLAKVQQH